MVQIKKSHTGFFPKEKAICLDSEDDNENEVQNGADSRNGRRLAAKIQKESKCIVSQNT